MKKTDPSARPVKSLEIRRRIERWGTNTAELIVGGLFAPLHSRRIIATGASSAGAGYHFQSDGWAYSQVLACVAGCGRVLVNDQWSELRAGEVYISPAGSSMGTATIKGRRWQIGWVIFNRDYIPPRIIEGKDSRIVRADARMFYRAIGWLYRESIGQTGGAIADLLAELIEIEARRLAAYGRTHTDAILDIWRKVDADLKRDWRMDELADILHVSSDHFRRLCIRRLGRTPMQQLLLLRMRRAMALLTMSEMKIQTIAESVGYADRFGFATAFERTAGMTPAKYRHNHQNTHRHEPDASELSPRRLNKPDTPR